LTLTNGLGGAGAGSAIDFEGYDSGVNPATVRIQSLDDNSYSSHLAFLTKTPGAANNALVERMRLTATGDVGIGTISPAAKLDVSNSGIGANGLSVQISDPNSLLARFGEHGSFNVDSPGVTGGRFRVQNVIAGGTVEINNPGGSPSEFVKLNVNGLVKMNIVPSVGVSLCLGAVPNIDTNIVVGCGISSIRHKKNVRDFTGGLDLLSKLRPVTFDWKRDDRPDFGLIAEEVAEAEPLLAVVGAKGEVEGVRYDRIGVIAVNAIKEQQEQITSQRKTIELQQKQIEALMKLVCAQSPTAEICEGVRP
jgi:hypothetical protein